MTAIESRSGIRCILLDIEGTTTPISFVHEILFSYARSHVKSFLNEHLSTPSVSDDARKLDSERDADEKRGLNPPEVFTEPRSARIESLTEYVWWLIDQDRKSTALKSLQGKIWQEGYGDGTLRAPIFADVPPALRRWQDGGLRISIFSSGSVLAQKLLFAHTESGDLTQFLSPYFDTKVGPKTDPESYRRIAAELDVAPAEVLFISDVVAELEAANDAGMRTLLCVRPGNPAQPASARHQIITNFDEV